MVLLFGGMCVLKGQCFVLELCVGGLDTRTAQEVRASSRAARGG